MLAKSNVMMCWCKARRTTYEIVYPQRCPAVVQSVDGCTRKVARAGTDAHPDTGFFWEEGMQNRIDKKTMALFFLAVASRDGDGDCHGCRDILI